MDEFDQLIAENSQKNKMFHDNASHSPVASHNEQANAPEKPGNQSGWAVSRFKPEAEQFSDWRSNKVAMPFLHVISTILYVLALAYICNHFDTIQISVTLLLLIAFIISVARWSKSVCKIARKEIHVAGHLSTVEAAWIIYLSTFSLFKESSEIGLIMNALFAFVSLEASAHICKNWRSTLAAFFAILFVVYSIRIFL